MFQMTYLVCNRYCFIMERRIFQEIVLSWQVMSLKVFLHL